MALYPPLNFEKDLQTRDTSLVPFIVLGNSSSSFKIISVFNDLSEIYRKKSKTLGEIAKDETKLEKYINDSFKKL